MLCAATAQADEPSEIETLDPAEIYGEDFETASDELHACGDDIDCGDWIDPAPQLRRGLTVLTELAVLVPSYSTTSFETKDQAFVAPRLSLGWEGENGFGVRGRGLWFDGAADARHPVYNSSSHYIAFTGGRFDLDFYKRVEHDTGHFTFGAGLTAAELKMEEAWWASQTTNYGGPYPFYSDYMYYNYGYYGLLRGYGLLNPDGIPVGVQSSSVVSGNSVTTTYHGEGFIRNTGGGLSLFVEGAHRFYETSIHAWSIFGRGRAAYLLGRWEAPYPGVDREADSSMAIGEGALGLEYRRKFRRADVALQCAFEIQSWDLALVNRVNFGGVTTGLSLAW